MPVHSKWQSLPTEAINPDTLALDKLSSPDIVEHMLHEDRKMLAAVQKEKERIAVGIDILTSALRHNGRIVFIGAGTSGRLGIVDASECPPTYGVPQGLVIGLIAGGDGAIRKAVEFAEDDVSEFCLLLSSSMGSVAVGGLKSGIWCIYWRKFSTN